MLEQTPKEKRGQTSKKGADVLKEDLKALIVHEWKGKLLKNEREIYMNFNIVVNVSHEKKQQFIMVVLIIKIKLLNIKTITTINSLR